MFNLELTEDEKEKRYQEDMNSVKEKWKQITMNGIKFNYDVSNKGFIRNRDTGRVLKFSRTGKNYIRISLRHENKYHRFTMHRLVALHFIKIPKVYKKMGLDYDSLVPNHLDGIKDHNIVTNLEWTTIRDNTVHAFDTGLANISMGENSHLAKMTNEQAKRCCELLQEGMTTTEIAKIVGVSKKSVQHIKSGECWTRLAKNYTFKRIGKAIPNSLTVEQIHEICKDLEQKKWSDSELGKKYGVSREHIRDIRNKKRRKDISINYNF